MAPGQVVRYCGVFLPPPPLLTHGQVMRQLVHVRSRSDPEPAQSFCETYCVLLQEAARDVQALHADCPWEGL